LDFTENVDDFVSFLKKVKAYGGGDSAEDILGAINIANDKLSFNPNALLQVFLVADAPTHGKQYHDGVSDDLSEEIPEGSIENALTILMKKGNTKM
jgi:hypothetical protein